MVTNKSTTYFLWVLKIIASAIMLQTLFFKFTAAPESVYIFTTLGLEPFGRIGVGALELTASILILISKTTVYGAILAMGLMSGAIFFHLTKLGIVVKGDGGQLFILAAIVFISSAILAYFYRIQLYILLFKNKNLYTGV